MTPQKVAGVVLGFVGVAVMIGGAALQSLGVDVAAQLAVLAGAVSYAFAGVFGRRFRAMGIAPMATATGQVTASSLMLLPLALLFVDRPWALPVPSAATVAAVLGAGAALDRARLHPLFPSPRRRRADEPAPRHLPHPGERDPARRDGARRAAGAEAFCRHGPHRPRPRGNRPRARRGPTRSLLQEPDSHMPASRSSLPPLGEAEWRGGVGVGGGWARREGDKDDAAAGPGQPSTPAPDRRRSASGKRPRPARALPESALPATRFASGGREEVRAADPHRKAGRAPPAQRNPSPGRRLRAGSTSPSGEVGAPNPPGVSAEAKSSRLSKSGGSRTPGTGSQVVKGCQLTWRPARRFLTKVLQFLSAVGSPQPDLACQSFRPSHRSDAPAFSRSASSLMAAPP